MIIHDSGDYNDGHDDRLLLQTVIVVLMMMVIMINLVLFCLSVTLGDTPGSASNLLIKIWFWQLQ